MSRVISEIIFSHLITREELINRIKKTLERKPLWNEWEKNIENVYVERGIEHDLEEFIREKSTNILFIIASSGKGKTSLLFFLIKYFLNSKNPVFFFENPESIEKIKEEICAIFDIKERKERFIATMGKRFGTNNRLIVFIDRFEYIDNKEEFIRQCENTNFVFYIASREEVAETSKDIQENNYKKIYLGDFSEKQAKKAITNYKLKIEDIPLNQ